MLVGRSTEQAVLEALITTARDGESGALVVRGQAGIGKTALLDHAAAAAEGLRVIRTEGVEFEAELPFAGLHLLLGPVLDHLDAIPARQAAALRGAFGLGPADQGGRFLVGLAVLSVLAELGPLLCVVDDAQWLDRASAEALTFAARRLQREGVILLFGVRDGAGATRLDGLPELPLWGLDRDASATLLSRHGADLAPTVRDRILAESEGNPLALIELHTALTPEQRGGAVQPLSFNLGPLPLPARVQQAFGTQAARLSEDARTFLLVAALEETGDLDIVLRAAATLGTAALDEVERSGLVSPNGTTLSFKHPLVRAAVIQDSPLTTRFAAHRALAEALGPSDRRAWHLAAATTGPDEQVAAELADTAEQAATRAGHAAQAAALERAAELTPDPERRAARLVGAAEAAVLAGDLDRAASIARRAAKSNLDPLPAARLAHVLASVEFERGSLRTAARTLIAGADAIAGTGKSIAMLAEAVRDGYFAGETALAAEAAAKLSAIAPASPIAISLDGLARMMAGDLTEAVPRMRTLTEAALAGQVPGLGERLIAGSMGLLTGDDESAFDVFDRLVSDARDSSQIGMLPNALEHLAITEVFLSRRRDASAHAEEAMRLAESIGHPHRTDHLRCVLAWIAAIAGDEETCRTLAEPAIDRALSSGIVRTAVWGTMAIGLTELSQGRYDRVLDRLETATRATQDRPLGAMNLISLAADQVEAAVRSGQPDRAREPLRRFEQWAVPTQRPWAAGVILRCKALLATDDKQDRLFAEAVAMHEQGGRPFERARTDLLYGEWLRRDQRKAEARSRLRPALETFERMGATPWADRARAELRATGDTSAPLRTESALDKLTPQELQVVRLAARGLSNRDIAAQLFLSPRTIGHHLYKAFPKLGIAGRGELPHLNL
ncbi:AAA family ATPase [Actinomadura barringtoniae]|uniref:AAA family ATPase n=1 Tax=Actinomadura barringtoniae TaxID=1427535 RepID=A0A939PSC9_9ACTN|nr:helix-turn-helix transcriptional regulator [Actinomadura barringtoniae]MBO2455373.1 AAA family ATPase [Actinomadura barringtoniae]